MAKVKLILLSLMAVMAVGAVMSASASAHEFLILGKKIAAGEKVLFLSKNVAGNSAILEQGTAGLKITCTAVTNHGFLEAAGKSTTTVIFNSCTVNRPAGCTVETPIVVKASDQLVLFEGILSDEFSPEGGGTTFTILKFSGAGCSLTTLEVNGEATGAVDNGNEALAHVLTFSNTSGTNLTTGGVASFFRLKDEIKLENDDLWKAE